VWRTARTPDGPATLRLLAELDGSVLAETWGPGAGWTLDALPAMLGDGDAGAADFAQLAQHDPFLAEALRRHPHWRVPRSGLVFEALLPAILEQKVTGHEAWAGWRALLRRFGDPAPGPARDLGLRVAPHADTVRRIPSWEWLALPVDPARSRTAVLAARVAPALERTTGLEHAEAERILRTLPGIGVWTAAEVRQRAHGDADAVSFGDYHIPSTIGYTLTGAPTDQPDWRTCSGRSGRTVTGCSGWWSCAARCAPAADRGWPPVGTCPVATADAAEGSQLRSPARPVGPSGSTPARGRCPGT